MKKLVFWWILILLLAGGGWWGWRYDSSQKSAERMAAEAKSFAKVERRSIEQFIYSRGEVTAPQTTEVKSEVPGMVSKVYVQPGDPVKQGQVLIDLNRSELESQVREATLQIQASQLKSDKIKLDLDRKEQLLGKMLIAQKDYDEIKIDHELSLNDLAFEGAKLETLKQQLAKTTILSPQDGMVLTVDARPGMVISGAAGVSAGSILLTVADLTNLEVQAQMNEIDVTRIQLKMPVKLTFDSIPGLTVDGTVNFISPSAIAKEDNKSVKTFPVIVGFTNYDPRIKVGITSKMTLSLAHVEQVLSLPISAVFVDGTTDYVYRRASGVYSRQEITVGVSDDKYIEIKSGLNEGDEVSLSPTVEEPTNKDHE